MATAAPIRDSRAAAAARKRQRKAERRDPAYTAWLHTQPCAVCGRLGVEQHHWPYRSKADWCDASSLALCAEHHRGKTGAHTLGASKFQMLHGISLAAKILESRGRFIKEKGQ